jgi:hypothetical protein
MADTIVDGTQFDFQNIRYSAPKANASGGKSASIINKSTNGGLRVSTPLMLTWGASDFVDEKTGKGNGKYELSLQFPSDEYKNDDTNAFLRNLQALESRIKADALVNSKEWFGKVHKNAEVVDALWTPMLKYSKDKATGEADLTKAPVLRVKVPTWEGVWKCEIYDEDSNRLFPNTINPVVSPLDFLQKGTNIAVLIQCGGLWFANGKFGVTWKLVQAIVQKPKASLSGTCFIHLKPSDKAKLKSAPAPEAVDEEEVVQTAEVEDSDDDEPEEVVSAPVVATPPPAPVVVEPVAVAPPAAVEEPKKKKVVKKKVVAEA